MLLFDSVVELVKDYRDKGIMNDIHILGKKQLKGVDPKDAEEAIKAYIENEDTLPAIERIPEKDRIQVKTVDDLQKLSYQLYELQAANMYKAFNSLASDRKKNIERAVNDAMKMAIDNEKAKSESRVFKYSDHVDVHAMGIQNKELMDKLWDISPELYFISEIAQPRTKNEHKKEWYNTDIAKRHFNESGIAELRKALDGGTGAGAEFIATGYSAQLIEKVRVQNRAVGAFGTFPLPNATYVDPIADTDPTIYLLEKTGVTSLNSGATATDINASTRGTTNLTYNAVKIGGRIYVTDDFAEDSLIAAMPYAQNGLAFALSNAIEKLVILGDVEQGTTNINSDGTAPTVSAGQTDVYIGFDGLVKKTFGDPTNQQYNANHTLTLADFDGARKLLGVYGLDPSQTVWFMPIDTYYDALVLSDFAGMDKLGVSTPLLTGQLGAIRGVPAIVSGQMNLTDDDGKYTVPNAGNDQNCAVIAYRPGVKLGILRNVRLETDRVAGSQQTQVIVTMRLDMKFPYGTASQAYMFNAD